MALLGFLLKRRLPGYGPFHEAQAIHERYCAEIGGKFLPSDAAIVSAARDEPRLVEAERLYRSAIDQCIAGQQTYNTAIGYFQLGLLQGLRGRFDEAQGLFQQALKLLEQQLRQQSNARTSISVCHFYLGQVLLAAGNKGDARTHLEICITLDEAVGYTGRLNAARGFLEQCAGAPASVPKGTAVEQPPPSPIFSPAVEKTGDDSAATNPSWTRRLLPATIWVVAHSAGAADVLGELTESSLAAVPDPPTIVRRAMESQRWKESDSAEMQADPHLCAVVLLLEPSGLADSRCHELIAWCSSRVSLHHEFRLFVLLNGMSLNELTAPTAVGKEVYELLRDTVQIAAADDSQALLQDLRDYIERLQEIRNEAEWLRLRYGGTMVLGYLAIILQFSCMIFGATLILWLPVWNAKATLRQFAGHENLAAALCCIGAVPLLALGLYAYTRYRPMLMRMREDPLGMVWAGLFSFVGAPMFGVAIRLKVSVPAIVLGLILGIILDIVRRAALRAHRERLPIDPATIAPRHGRLPANLRAQAQGRWINPWRCPLAPLRSQRVFISYTRASDWANHAAHHAARVWRHMGHRVFLDKDDIPKGGNWRWFLNQHLSRSTVFVALVDEKSVEREWPAAEMESALNGRRLTNLPQIIIFKAPSAPYASDQTWTWLPAFRATVLPPGERVSEDQPRLFADGPAGLAPITHLLHPEAYRSVSVLPPGITGAVDLVWKLLTIPLSLVNSTACPTGYLAFIVVLAELFWGGKCAAWLARHSLLAPAFLFGAIVVGGLARTMLAAKYHLRHERAIYIFLAHRNAAIGWTALLAVWAVFQRPSWMLGGLAVALFAMSWWAADEFCVRQARKDPNFLRLED